MLNDFIWLASYVAMFLGGFFLCDRMYRRFEHKEKVSLRTQYSRLSRHLDADDPAVEYDTVPSWQRDGRRFTISREFHDRLLKNGKATTLLRKAA